MARRVGRGWRPALAVILAVPVVSGCGLLYGAWADPFYGGMYPGGMSPDDGMPSPSIAARYTSGSATIEFEDGTTIELDEVATGSSLDLTFGSSVRWTGDDGWQMALIGGGTSSDGWSGPPMLQFDRLTNNQHWTTWDPSRCIVETTVIDETAVRGTATCRGVEWIDALGGGMGMGMDPPEPIEGETWSGEIMFEALPDQEQG